MEGTERRDAILRRDPYHVIMAPPPRKIALLFLLHHRNQNHLNIPPPHEHTVANRSHPWHFRYLANAITQNHPNPQKMAQNAPQTKPSTTAKSSAKKPSQRKQTGNRVIKPKKTALVKQQQQKKRNSAGLAALTEKSLAGKAGHLEMLRGGKRDTDRKTGGAKELKGKGKG